MNEAVIHIDGGSRGNPGPASWAVVMTLPDGEIVEKFDAMGTASNNVAEYTALVNALATAVEMNLQTVHIKSDSELLVKQMNGEYRVKHPDLLPLYERASQLRRQIPSVKLTHVRREQNKRADELCNMALDAGKPKAATPVAGVKPKAVVSDATVRGPALECLNAAINAEKRPPAAMVWDQLWSILEEGGVLRKK